MKNRGFILEVKEHSKTDREILPGDVFTLVNPEKRNEFYCILTVVKRKKMMILLTKKIKSLGMVSQVQNFNANEFVMRDLGKGKCEVVIQDYSNEEYG